MATLSRMMDHLQQDLSPVSNSSSPSNQHSPNTVATTADDSASRTEIIGSRSAPTPDSPIE